MAGYFGEYFRHHWRFPLTLNTDQIIGMPFPIFYGTLFFPVAGLISAITGANLAVRILVAGILWLQTVQVIKLSRLVHPSKYVGWALGAIVCFAAYPLTNIYNRSAITEFAAASLLVSACCLWLRAAWGKETVDWKRASLAWLLLTLSAGTHPITALLGCGAFGLLVTGSLALSSQRGKLSGLLLVNAAAFLTALAPWIYATLRFGNDLAISTFTTKVFVFRNLDLPWVRFMPFPFDPRIASGPFNQISTPYLDVQINMGLLILAGFLGFQMIRAIRSHKLRVTSPAWLALCSAALFAGVTFCSLSKTAWIVLPKFLSIVQFSYRLVTYCDLLLLLTVLFLLAAMKDFQAGMRTVLVVCLVLMTGGVIVKFTHAAAIAATDTFPATSTQMPSSFYGAAGYAVLHGFGGQLPVAPKAVVVLKTGTAADFGEVSSQSISLDRATTAATNVQSFPWNRLTLNGQDVPVEQTYVVPAGLLAINLPAGTSAAGYRFVPDPIYSALRMLAGLALAGWAGLLSYAFRR